MESFQLSALTAQSSYLAAFFTGVLLHLSVFRVGEWDLYTPHLLFGTVLFDVAASFALRAAASIPTSESFATVSPLVGTCVVGIFSSIVLFRALFHRLNRFPGPFMARLSNFYITTLSLRKCHLYEEVRDLHAKYGDIVRIGPSELSVADPKAYNLIHSNQSPCTKGPWYNIMHPVQSLHMMRDKEEHSNRRKAWDRGLGSKALRDYEPRVHGYVEQLLGVLDASIGKPVNVSQLFNFYSFDVMGDLAFGKGFNMLKDGIVHYYMESVHASMDAVMAFSHLVWLFPLIKAIPVLNSEHLRLHKWLAEQVKQRRSRTGEQSDLFSWLLADYDTIKSPSAADLMNLHGDAHLICVAGSDTTAASLTCLFHELVSNPSALRALTEEVDAYFAQHETPDAMRLSKLPYLQACINEALRLYPPVASGVQRMTPPGGLQVGEKLIPGNAIVTMPTYTLSRDARLYEQPDDFIPERWTTRPSLVKDGSVFAPFGTGRYSCAGKQLGLMEIRFVTAQVLRRYNVRMAPGQSSARFLAGCKDAFTLATGKLNLVFEQRQKPVV